ncbi:MAG: bifunctional diaminohydroxyphosphoribosylaminopyrimidine deaminase/5-amino-6-(5-phosphoribosylamino)uracil reductase RibD [Verrucomicrobiota bacterium]|nr:bifunctional diaminohydroxyphosphoribosylaminopyrimidine deaminase/5-amino-6-(5-phosphoribosylamino)uracil reductase RibD [Verrucomicrobiota bacterium]
MNTADDERFMRAALAEAEKGAGQTSPNPVVGAVLVCAGEVIAAGYHHAAGLPHAEVECLRKAARPVPPDAALYVTLEPCSTTGRTPPCTDAIVAAGVRNVVVGALDVNPKHRGRGIDLLRKQGVTVRSGILSEQCSALNAAFNKWIQTKRPFVIAKCGMSLDGRLTRPRGEEQWITSRASREHANRRRARVDAILVGAETVRADNPRLTARKGRGARQPWRVVLTRSGKLPADAHLFTDAFADRTLVFRNQPLAQVLAELGAREVTSVLIEGGGEVLAEAFDARLIDRVEIYMGPLLTGGPVLAFPGRGAGSTAEGVHLRNVCYERIGSDIFVTGDATDQAASSE